jgi:hypothetical protein
MGTEYIVGSLIASHLFTALGSWYVGHKGLKAAVAAVQSIPTTVTADVAVLKTDVATLKAKLP